MKIDLNRIVREASYKKPTLEEFLSSSGRRNVWVRDEDTKITAYLRRTKRYIGIAPGGVLTRFFLNTIDLANFTVDDTARGQGNFSRFLKKVANHPATKDRSIFVESVMGGDEDRGFLLADYFRRLTKEDLDYEGLWFETEEGGFIVGESPNFVLLRSASIISQREG